MSSFPINHIVMLSIIRDHNKWRLKFKEGLVPYYGLWSRSLVTELRHWMIDRKEAHYRELLISQV